MALSSPEVLALLGRDTWEPESDLLNNGVSVAPDLLGTRNLAELKTIDPRKSYYDPAAYARQVRGYIAWAMVEFGAERVAHEMSAHLVHLHPEVPVGQRVREVDGGNRAVARALWIEQLALRVRNRHQLLAVQSGAWLPMPRTEECEHCELSQPDTLPSGDVMSAACTFHCQAERHWDCHGHGRTCPLLEVCDQYDRYEDPEKLDRFNQLRAVLLDEEEQQAALAEVEEGVLGAGLASEVGLLLGPFTVSRAQGAELRLKQEGPWQLLRFAIPGVTY